MNKYSGLVFADDKIRATWQTRSMQPVPNASAEEAPAEDKLRLGIFAANTTHHC
ncbi:MAG TPA: hypothetical protein VFC37_11005 [Terracidiphilus sp.]|nr:hypothetical protein [Terracidiphilus sp.]